jgi:hypothetical protein
MMLRKSQSPTGDCDTMPIFAPGKDVLEAAQHDLQAELKQPQQWTILNSVTKAEKLSTPGVVDQWYNAAQYRPICPSPRPTVNGSATECDEYPFFATEQGGNQAAPTPSLKLIKYAHNNLEGRLYSGFKTFCGLDKAPRGDAQRQFIVVPIVDDPIPTSGWCRPAAGGSA